MRKPYDKDENIMIKNKPYSVLILFIALWAAGCAGSKSNFESQSTLLTVDTMPQNGKCRITGRVIDRFTKESLDGAIVEVISPLYISKTDLKGSYTINELDAGEYNISARMSGYKHCTLSHIKLGKDLIIVVDFELAPENMEPGK
jgi:hypothetical protein